MSPRSLPVFLKEVFSGLFSSSSTQQTYHSSPRSSTSKFTATVCRWRSAVFPWKNLIRGGELFCLYRRNREMEVIEPAEAESQFSCSWLIYTGVPINHHWLWSHHRQSANIEGPCSSHLHCLPLPTSSATSSSSSSSFILKTSLFPR